MFNVMDCACGSSVSELDRVLNFVLLARSGLE